jgi:hypothetical protein
MMERDPCCSTNNLYGECESRFLKTIGAKLSKEWREVDKEQLYCRNPTLAKCGGGEAQHLEKLGVGVLRDSRMFRVRQQGEKHLALGCSWCH